MNNETQFMKGILEGCILKILKPDEMYGYKAVEVLRKFGFDINEATVYPILLRLQSRGLLCVEKRPSPLGPDRKYYYITKDGEDCLLEFRDSWSRFEKIVNKIMEGCGND